MFDLLARNSLLACLCLAGATACTDGPLIITERYYLAAKNERNTNYYRITVKAHTQLSKAEFRQGWYPADSVDTLFGEVSSEAGAETLQTEKALRDGINETLLALDKQYRETLMNFEGPNIEEKISKIREARRRLFAVPDLTHGKQPDTDVIEYHPAKNLITQRSGSKLVFVLSADPRFESSSLPLD